MRALSLLAGPGGSDSQQCIQWAPKLHFAELPTHQNGGHLLVSCREGDGEHLHPMSSTLIHASRLKELACSACSQMVRGHYSLPAI